MLIYLCFFSPSSHYHDRKCNIFFFLSTENTRSKQISSSLDRNALVVAAVDYHCSDCYAAVTTMMMMAAKATAREVEVVAGDRTQAGATMVTGMGWANGEGRQGAFP